MHHPLHLRTKTRRHFIGNFLLAGFYTLVLPSVIADPASEQLLVTQVPGIRSTVEIVETKFSADRTEATATLRSKLGIFSIQLQLADLKLAKITLLIQGERHCEGLDFWPPQGAKIELRRSEGVKIAQRDKDLAIEFTGPALATLGKGGKLLYVNLYR